MKRTLFLCLAFFYTGNSIADQPKALDLVCFVQKQYVCSSQGCNENLPSITIQVEQIKNGSAYYSRCDNKRCDRYESSISQPGAYIEVSPNGKSSRLKIYSEDLTFMDTASLGLTSYISFGICRLNSLTNQGISKSPDESTKPKKEIPATPEIRVDIPDNLTDVPKTLPQEVHPDE